MSPWSFLRGGAPAVEVSCWLDGDELERRYLWRGGGPEEARDADGAPLVRWGEGGFELVLASGTRAREGAVEVDGRGVSLRELALCGVRTVPLSAATRVVVRSGVGALVVAGTTAPRRVPLRRRGEWARELALLATGCMFVLLVGGLVRGGYIRADGEVPRQLAPVRVRAILPSVPPRVVSEWEPLSDRPLPLMSDGSTQPSDVQREWTRRRAPKVSGEARARAELRGWQRAQAAAARANGRAAQAAADARARVRPDSASERGHAAHPAIERGRAAANAALDAQEMRGAKSSAPDGAAARAASAGASRADGAAGAMAAAARPGNGGVRGAGRPLFAGAHALLGTEIDDSGPIGLSGPPGVGHDGSGHGAVGRGDGASGVGQKGGGGAGAAGGEGSGDGGLGLAGAGSGEGDGGLGLSGIGDGTGGDGYGGAPATHAGEGDEVGETIGIGGIGTVGYGAGGGGSGEGSGYGRGVGGLGGRRALMPDVVEGSAALRPVCEAHVVRRVIRAHLNEIRYCYERLLQGDPTLAGRVVTAFRIDERGKVVAAGIRESTIGSVALHDCISAAELRMEFPPSCAGDVRYPFVFQRADALLELP